MTCEEPFGVMKECKNCDGAILCYAMFEPSSAKGSKELLLYTLVVPVILNCIFGSANKNRLPVTPGNIRMKNEGYLA